MATLIVRNLDTRLVENLKQRARRHGRSAEAEHRLILETALAERTPMRPIVEKWLQGERWDDESAPADQTPRIPDFNE